MQICASLNIVSGTKVLEPETIWWAAIKKSKWGTNKKEIELVKSSIKAVWDPIYGDRRNELIFIGRHINKDKLLKSLEECLLSDDEFEKGDAKWKTMFKDPFTKWKKVAETHPLKDNFKYVDDEWEEVETDEEDGEEVDSNEENEDEDEVEEEEKSVAAEKKQEHKEEEAAKVN